MIYNLSKKLLTLSFFVFALTAITFTFAKNDNKESDDAHGKTNYLNGNYSHEDEEDDDDDDHGSKNYKPISSISGDFGTGVIITSGQIVCVKDAVEKREISIITANTTFQATILQALNTRKTDLLNARSLTTKEQIKSAVKKSREVFKSNKKFAQDSLQKGEKLAGDVFKLDVKACNMDNIINNIEKEGENTFKEIKKQNQSPSGQNLVNKKTPKPTPPVIQPQKPTSPTYTLQDIQAHKTMTNCWTTINSKVYNLTSAFGQHPGGDTLLASLCGIEGTAKFNGKHGASASAKAMLSKLQIGTLK